MPLTPLQAFQSTRQIGLLSKQLADQATKILNDQANRATEVTLPTMTNLLGADAVATLKTTHDAWRAVVDATNATLFTVGELRTAVPPITAFPSA